MDKAWFLPAPSGLQERSAGTEGMGRVFARGDKCGPGEASTLRSRTKEGTEATFHKVRGMHRQESIWRMWQGTGGLFGNHVTKSVGVQTRNTLRCGMRAPAVTGYCP